MTDYMIIRAEISSGTLDYVKFGNGKRTFIVLPGAGFKNICLFAEFLVQTFSAYTEEYTVYVMDRRNENKAGMTVEDYAEDIAEVMVQLKIDKADIYGASLGGMMALAIAYAHPELAGCLSVASSSACPRMHGSEVLEELISYAEDKDIRTLSEKMCRHLYTEKFLEKTGDSMFMTEKDVTADEVSSLEVQLKAVLEFDFRERLKNIKCPLLITAGEMDRILPPSSAVYMAENSGGFLRIIEGLSHAVYDEYPGFYDMQLDFFRRMYDRKRNKEER